jgi:tetratricopeptide (TPR) repeat protein
MKTKVLALALGLLTISSFAQKNELKTAERAIKKQDYNTAMTAVTAAESLIGNMDTKLKAKFYFLKAQAYLGKKDFQVAADAFTALKDEERKSGRKKYTDAAKPMQNQMVQEVYKKATNQYKAKDFKNASDNFYLTYKLSPQDTIFVYNAAVSSTLAKEYDGALKYYKELQDLRYTGVSTLYFATNKDTGVKENLGSKDTRDLYIKAGDYKDPVEEKTDSKTGDIIKNIALILKAQGKNEEAVKAIEEARKIFPKDLNLILTQADIYFQLGQTEKFGELMQLAIKEDPTNPLLFFNLGVISSDQKKNEEAKEYYKKAIELKPDYGDAYLNLAVLIMDDEKAIVEEMNKNLSDFDAYDALLAKQKDVYKRALPYLERADEHGRSLNTVQILMNIYSTLEMTEKEKEYSTLYKMLRGQ